VRVPIELTTQQIEDLQKAIHGPSPIIYITSSDSVATLLHAIRPVPGAREWFLHGAAVTIHPRCAERLREAGFVHVEITGTLDERVREHIVSNLLRLT
jgi:uroporphyrinogen-III synthase